MTATLISAADSRVELTPPQEPIPASYFDLNIIFYPGLKVPWPPVPFYSWRLAHANWFELEPQKGQWKFDHLDQLADWAQEHNAEILMILSYTPAWASSRPDAPSDIPNLPGIGGPLHDMDDWRTFVRTVATRYKGRIHTYELWNEPDRQKSWTGDMDSMVQMTREAYEILKRVDPSITVVSPSATYGRGPAWLSDFLKKGGGQYADVIGYHFYTGGTGSMPPPEAVVPLIQRVRGIMEQNGVGDKPLWNTEEGWLGSDFYPPEKASAYVARAYVLNWAAGVKRFYWYAWESHHGSNIELVTPDDRELTAAGQAYATIQAWLTGGIMNHVWTSENHDWIFEIYRPGNRGYIVWNEAGERDFRISKDWHVSRVVHLDGSAAQITGDSVAIGQQPVLLQ